jgi:hypothetical protein
MGDSAGRVNPRSGEDERLPGTYPSGRLLFFKVFLKTGSVVIFSESRTPIAGAARRKMLGLQKIEARVSPLKSSGNDFRLWEIFTTPFVK